MRLVYLSPVPWMSFSQRPHELVRYFHATTQSEVLWIDPYSTRFPVWDDINRLNKGRRNGCNIDENVPNWLSVVKPQAVPIEPLPLSGSINRLMWGRLFREVDEFSKGDVILGIGKPSVLALQLLSRKIYLSSFYDVMDDFPAFYHGLSHISMSFRERSLLGKVSQIFVSSSSLRERITNQGRSVDLVLNACASTRLPEPIARSKQKVGKIPVLGYIGTIGRWFDWKLLKLLADARPDVNVRLIGPVFSSPPGKLPTNVEILPPCSHDAAINAMNEFDIGLIPFKLTKLTASVDPIKFYEYRSLGLPVISSMFGEMTMRSGMNGIYLIDNGSNFSETISKALDYKPNATVIEKFRTENSWESRFKRIDIFNSV